MKNTIKHKRGFLLGKFYPPTIGHAYLVESSRQLCDHLVVLVCSIPEETFIDGPTRLKALQEYFSIYGDSIKFKLLDKSMPQEPKDDEHFWDKWMKEIKELGGEDIDVVFSSEDYGYEIAKRLGEHVVHEMVDKDRTNVPVSGTMTRSDIFRNYHLIIPTVRHHFNKSIAIMGPESTGKSTLTKMLADHFSTTYAYEYGREFSQRKPNIEPIDFLTIARKHRELIDQANRDANKVFFADTEHMTTKIFLDLYHPELSHNEIKDFIDEYAFDFDLYILLDIDVPFVNDGTRLFENKRKEHFDRILNELQKHDKNFVILRGSHEQKFLKAIFAVHELIR